MADDELKDELKLNIDLCVKVEKHPCLYDITRDDHSKRQILEKAWAEISGKVGLSAEACKKRWANLRTVFVRRRSKPPKSGSGFKKEYYLNKYMQFIIPHTKLAVESTGSNLPPVPREHSDRKKQPSTLEEGQSSESQDINRDVDGDDDLVSLDVEESQNGETDHNRPTINSGSRQYSGKREKPLGSVDRAFLEYFHSRRQKRNLDSENPEKPLGSVDRAFLEYFHSRRQKRNLDSENPRKCFLLSLQPELDQLPEYQFKVFKRRVLALLDELDMSRPNSSSSMASHDGWGDRCLAMTPNIPSKLDNIHESTHSPMEQMQHDAGSDLEKGHDLETLVYRFLP
ncbi:Alcohol dehydrogenase transcription factor Myb/SANT-like [Popillia japonica]|uniref:Alcohol dehydrogenase transcription factor Myb/SANT-like n=1 Tax=Popillia japonica TaxID=7064 RepID=A0AAW1JW21_POPJA